MKRKMLLLVTGIILLFSPGINYAQAPNLGSAAGFVFFTTTGAVTNSGTDYMTHLTGNVGTNSAPTFTGFGNVNGVMHNIDASSAAAAASLTIANAMMDTVTATVHPTSSTIGGGDTLTSGVYSYSGSATLSGNLYLNAGGDSTAVFIFLVNAGTLNISANSKVYLLNGAKAYNVYWKASGAVSAGSNAMLKGTIISNGAITLSTGDTLEGRGLSTAGAIALNQVNAYLPLGGGIPALTGPAAPAMDSLAWYGLFTSNGSVSNTGTDTAFVHGNVGSNTATPTGFNPLFVSGNIYGPGIPTDTAAANLSTVYNYLDTLTYDINLIYPAELGHSLTLTPHTYLLSGATALTDTLYLDAEGNPNAIFALRINGAFSTASNANVVLLNGAQAKNVYWLVNGASSLGSNSTFNGNIVGGTSSAISMASGVLFNGRALTRDGSITTTGGTFGPSVLPMAGPITGDSVLCVGASTTLSGGDTGGVWSASNGNATVTSGGVVTGVTAGLDTISYVVTNSVGSDTAIHIMTISPAPNAGAITGSNTVCVGSMTTLSDTTATGGTWSASNMNATITDSGVVTGVTPGMDTILYSVTNSCGTATTSFIMTVNALPYAGVISGDSSACRLLPIALTSSGDTVGFFWTATNLNATVNDYGAVVGYTRGLDTIVYTVTNTCGTATTSKVIMVDSSSYSGTITGDTSVCVGGTTTLTDTAPGGTWSSSNAHATVSSGGVVTGVSAGSATISYSVNNACGSSFTTQAITVSPAPNAGTITGASVVCGGASITLTDTASGGTWRSSNAHATVSGGTVTGVSAGVDTIKYIVTNTCGADTATKRVTVSAAPYAATIEGPSSVCTGNTITLTDSTAGGNWTSSNAHATVVGGVVTGVSTGTSVITYIVNNGCGNDTATKSIAVNPAVTAGTITGASTVCTGATTTLTDGTTGGTWSATNSHATVAGGIVTGVSAGMDTIRYIVTNTCGTDTATKTITVNSSANAGTITGASTVCTGATATVTDGATGGTWSATNGHATVAGGTVTGVTAGVDTIRYIVSNTCGADTATRTITVNNSANAGTISGASGVCTGNTTTLTDTATGGLWTATNSHATVVGGVVTGVSAGFDTIRYTVTNTCGTDTAIKAITVNSSPNSGIITGGLAVCTGMTDTLTDAATGGTWSATNSHASVAGGVVRGITSGIDTIRYIVSNSCGADTTSRIVTVNQSANAGTITGPSGVCTASTITLADTATGGVWTSTNAHATVVGGLVTGVTTGRDTIRYIVTTTCGSDTATKAISVNASPDAGTISGSGTVCTGSTTTLTDTVTGGTWHSSNATATVSSGGVVTGVTTGVDTIRYIVNNGCGTDTATKRITVNLAPAAGTITGGSVVCVGSSITLTDTTSGGTWSASNTNASITSGGVVTGATSGLDTIKYTVTGSCGTATATKVVTVGAYPGAITGSSFVCTGSSITLADAVSGGTWRSRNVHATVASGVVTGVTAGIDTIMYIVTNSCGTDTATKTVTVNTSASASSLAGPANVCVGNTITLTDSATGGTWSASNGHATVSAGTVTGVSTGADTIRYIVSNTCGSDTATKVVTINLAPVAGTISGPDNVCTGASITLTDTTTGGTWSASNSHATVSGGVVTGVTSGTVVISYTVTNVCGSSSATQMVTVNPYAGVISGPSVVCIGSSITLTDTVSGGTWSRSNTNASVSGGVVTGNTNGQDTITYTITNACGTNNITKVITVQSMPNAGTISGPSTACIGTSETYTDIISGGSWAVSNGHATISGGTLTGVNAGIDTIVYSITNACGTDSALKTVTINGLPDTGSISGASVVCIGSSITLTNSTTGGTWSSTNSNATVTGSGVVTGVTGGMDTIRYYVTNTCGTDSAMKVITVGRSAGSVSGSAVVCIGSSVTLSDSSTGGTWTATNTHATISSTGVVTGNTAGTDTIRYALNNSCGLDTTTHIVTVNPAPYAGVITGPTNVCIGAATGTTLSDTVLEGVWTSSNTNATISFFGVVTGVTAGTDTIRYTVTNACGSNTATSNITINPMPYAGSLPLSETLCLGSGDLMLTDSAVGGTWISSDTLATVSGGTVTGRYAGMDTIYYVVSNACGADSARTLVTISNPPTFIFSTPVRAICDSSLFTYTPMSDDSGATFMWTRAFVPGISNSGTSGVGDISESLVNITPDSLVVNYDYTISANGCSSTAVIPVTVYPTPRLNVSLTDTVCSGAPFTFTVSGATPGTTFSWSRSYTTGISPATGSGSGNISETLTDSLGIKIGVNYIVTDSLYGCIGHDNVEVVVNPLPATAGITTMPTSSLCSGTMYQNFGTTSAPASGTVYTWSAINAEVFATGTNGQNAIISFPDAGTAEVILSVRNTAYQCTSQDTVTVSVGTSAAPTPTVLYVVDHFVCTPYNEDSYQWGYDAIGTLDSTVLAGEINQDYLDEHPDFTTKYYWVITTKNGCMQKTYYNAPTAIQNVNAVTENSIEVFPNPANDQVNVAITTSITGNIVMEVVNMAGQKISSVPVTNHKASLDVANYPAGIYMVNCFSEGTKIAGTRFIKN